MDIFPIMFRVLLQSLFVVFRKFHYRVIRSTSIWKNMKYQRISKYPLKPAVRFDWCPIEIQVRSRIWIQPAPAAADRWNGNACIRHQTPGLVLWSSSVILTTPVALRAGLERSTLNGSSAKKLIIVPSTMARHHMPIRVQSDTHSASFFEKHFHPLQNQSRCNRRTYCDAGNEHVEREERTYFRCFRCPSVPRNWHVLLRLFVL